MVFFLLSMAVHPTTKCEMVVSAGLFDLYEVNALTTLLIEDGSA